MTIIIVIVAMAVVVVVVMMITTTATATGSNLAAIAAVCGLHFRPVEGPVTGFDGYLERDSLDLSCPMVQARVRMRVSSE